MCSNWKAWKWQGFRMAPTARRARFAFPLLLLFALVLGTASSVQAAGVLCSDFGGVVDGSNPATLTAIQSNSTFGIDMNCTVKNFPQSMGGFPIVNINFNFPGQQSFYIVFDNVYYYGNMSCNDPTQSTFWIYWAPGGYNNISPACQEFMVPVDAVIKQNPPAQTTATIGVPFTYTITAPYLGQLDSTGTFNYVANSDAYNISNVVITDDLTQGNTAALTYVANTAYLVNASTGVRTPLGSLVNSGTNKQLNFTHSNNPALVTIPAGYHIEIDLTVVLDNNTTANYPGNTFTNTVDMRFDKTINSTPMTNLHAWPSTTPPMTIVGPNLVVGKTSTVTNLNIGSTAPFKIDVQNIGSSIAWDATITDDIPAGMCTNAPTSFTANLYASNGTTLVSNLVQGTDYSLTWTGGTAAPCQLILTMLDTSANQIGPNQHLIINYGVQFDAGIQPGLTFTNIAGATQWFGAKSSDTGRHMYGPYTLTTGTPGTEDYQDAFTITSATTGYFFLKSVGDVTTGVFPATAAFPGDTLRYTLQIQNFQVPELANITIIDDLGLNTSGAFVSGISIFSSNLPGTATVNTCASCGTNGAPQITISNLNLPGNTQYQIQFDVTLGSALTNGTIVSNQASLSGTNISGLVTGVSDDPFTFGPAQLSLSGDKTKVTIQAPGALSKANTQSTATIGQQFSYLITVPATPINVPLYDVRILDNLGLSAADLSFVPSAQVVSGGTWNLSNTGTATNLVIQDMNTGIDIPAGGQAVIQVTVTLQNTATNHSGLTFTNTASYTYNKINGINSTQMAGPAGVATNMNVVEPAVTAGTKTVTNVTAGKLASDPAATGDVLQYVITIPNSGSSTAYDTDVIDILPVNESLVSGSATAQINGVSVTGFIVNPTILASGAPAWWGRQNGDDTLDIPAGQSLVLTYRVSVVYANGLPINNSFYVDWTSLQDVQSGERTGAGCPTITSPNNYCYGPVSTTFPTVDTTTTIKSVVSDSWSSGLSTSTDSILRVGDTVVYRLGLTLREGQLQNVVVTDTLPAGLAFDSVISINGDTSAPFTSVAPFSYNNFTAPTINGNIITWSFGDITNAIDYNSANNTIVIEYRARVVTNTLIQQLATNLSNSAKLAYTGSSLLSSSANITVWQPIMSTPTKIDRAGRTSPAQINVTTDTMQFSLGSCNNGTAPAYSVKFTDVLASQLNQTTITTPTVRVGGTTLTAGSDYTYTPPASRGGTMTFVLSSPVDPGQCITIDYNIGFYTDFGPNQTWNNTVTLDEYWSLPLQSGQKYGALGPATFTMTNSATISQPSKTLYSPASGEATIGDEVVYRITVPTTAINAALFDVTVTDTLNSALEYISATDVSGNNYTLTDSSVLPGQVNLTIAQIAAGKQAIIELHARVANNSAAKAGVSFLNSATYTYANTAGGAKLSGGTGTTALPLRIIEPVVTLTKSVSNQTSPGVAPTVGDILRYTLVFQAAGGATTDSYSSAFDLTIAEALTLGLAYTGNVAVSGAGNTISAPIITGDGITTPQSLSWGSASANIDIPEGTMVTVYYDVTVLNNVQSGQTLAASTSAQWTGLNGVNTYERTGSGTPAVNNYFLGPVVASIITQLPVLTFDKTVYDVTTGLSGANAKPGDTLKYTLTIQNGGSVGATNFSLTDELDKLNASAMFVPGSLTLVTVPTGANTTLTSATGGTKGTGLVSISNLSIGPLGGPGDNLVIEFQAKLVPVITSGSVVLNQAQIGSSTLPTQLSDDPSIAGTTNPTQTLIASAPAFRVVKTAQDITSGTATVMAGDTLRYTITVKNIGTENAVGVTLRDQIPAYTTYVANSTKLNGVALADPGAGVSALQNGLSINSPANLTAGAMPADAGTTTNNVATITFDVQISQSVINGTIISNQGFVNGSGANSGPFTEQPSDNPATPVLNDPTTVVVGSLPLVYALKTVQLAVDVNGNGYVDPGDTLQYTLTLTNSGATSATGVVLTDAVPAYTTYVANSVQMNGASVAQPDGGVSPLINGIGVVSSGLTPPSPPSSGGTLAAGSTGIVTFKVTVNTELSPGVPLPSGTIISNQGSVATAQLLPLLTDSDGNASNGYQPTVVTVGNAQQLSITKSVVVVGGGAALPGSVLEYTIQATNIGMVPATNVVITDDLTPLAAQATYVAGSATMNGSTNGVSFISSVITANYGTTYGSLASGSSVVVRFEVKLNSNVVVGTTVTNTAQASWNSPVQTAPPASASVNVGGIPGSASLNGEVWQDANFDKIFEDGTEQKLSNWAVNLYLNGQLMATVYTGTDGSYQLTGLTPSSGTMQYELRFLAPGSGLNTAMMGWADSPVTYNFTNGMQRISNIVAVSGSSLQGLNLPLTPNGVVYNSMTRVPLAGATLTMVRASNKMPLPSSCFNDPAQQNQVTTSSGYYKFDLNFSDSSSCPSDGDYLIQVTPPGAGYAATESQVIPPTSGSSTAAYSVPTCRSDAVMTTPNYCEALASDLVPATSVSPGPNTTYYLRLRLNNAQPGYKNQIYNNPIPVDPILNGAVAITKISSMTDVTKGTLVPYTITATNVYGVPLYNIGIVDRFPAGFKYVVGSARLDGNPVEPQINGRELVWDGLELQVDAKYTLRLLLVVGSGVSEGEYVNRAFVRNTTAGTTISEEATATVRVVPDPDFDCTDVIGKVFDDGNLNGQQDPGEKGLPGVRVVTARGLISTSDKHGRFHIDCAAVPDEDRGSNFILKLDERSLPTGYRLTTESPRVLRATRGKMLRFNFGATIHRVVRIDIADGVFEPDTTELRMQWIHKIDHLLEELKKAPSVLRLSYLGDVEPKGLVRERLDALKKKITKQWKQSDGWYRLAIEIEIFWRRGAPPSGQ